MSGDHGYRQRSSIQQWLDEDQTWPGGHLRPEAPAWIGTILALSRNLSAALVQRGWSVADLAERAQVDENEVAALLAGDSVPLDVLVLIEAAIGDIYPTGSDVDPAAPPPGCN